MTQFPEGTLPWQLPAAFKSQSENEVGVLGVSTKHFGVAGVSIESSGVYGWSEKSNGVLGVGNSSDGVVGFGTSGNGVVGRSLDRSGVVGTSENQTGVTGESRGHDGVYGLSHSAQHSGVAGVNDGGNIGVYGRGATGGYFEGTIEGIHGLSHNSSNPGVAGYNDSTGPGVYGKSTGGGLAGYFDGNVTIGGTLTAAVDIVLGADCAEEFDVAAIGEAEPGTVMVLDEHGTLQPSQRAYDKKVAGVISGAGDYKPGLILDKKESSEGRMPIALVGKVYCKVDAQYASIEMGDLLTTSSTPGHAMKADDPFKAFGAVIGKALRPLEAGQGLIPILVALQ